MRNTQGDDVFIFIDCVNNCPPPRCSVLIQKDFLFGWPKMDAQINFRRGGGFTWESKRIYNA